MVGNGASLTMDRYIGPVVVVTYDGVEEALFLCCGKWVALSECEAGCPRYWRCDNVAQVNMVGSEEYREEVR